MLDGSDLRVTRPRRLVWEVLAAEPGHLTAAEIADRVHQKDSSINVSSVYRTLATFAERRLVRESRLGSDDVSYWETAHADHVIHLVCSSCNAVVHHDSDSASMLRREVFTAHKFVSAHVEVTVTGLCINCTV